GRESEAQLRRGLREAAALVAQHHAAGRETLLERARLVADLPKLKAAIDTRDPTTIEPLARDYRERGKADVFALTDRNGRILAALGDAAAGLASGSPVQRAQAGVDATSLQAGAAGIYDVVTVPVSMVEPPELLGTLTLGSSLDDALAARFKALTG